MIFVRFDKSATGTKLLADSGLQGNGQPLTTSSLPSGCAAFLLCRPRQPARVTAVSFQPSRAFFFHLNLVGSGVSRCQSPIISAATKADLPAFLLCCPQQPARVTAVSLQPRQPFFFLSRKKEKVGGKKKESFAYGKRRNAVRCLRRGKRRFILPTIANRFIPHCRCAALHSIKS